jgi:hypothetical protein
VVGPCSASRRHRSVRWWQRNEFGSPWRFFRIWPWGSSGPGAFKFTPWSGKLPGYLAAALPSWAVGALMAGHGPRGGDRSKHREPVVLRITNSLLDATGVKGFALVFFLPRADPDPAPALLFSLLAEDRGHR